MTNKSLDFFNKGNEQFELQNNQGAIKNYKMAIAINANYGEAHFRLGYTLFRIGKHEDAIQYLTKSTRLLKHPITYNCLGKCLFAMGEFKKAGVAYKKSLKLDGSNLDALAGQANIMVSENKLQDAYALLVKHVKNHEFSTGTANVLTRICHKINIQDETLSYLLAYSESLSDNDWRKSSLINSLLGEVYDKLKRYNEAYKYYQKSNSVVPSTYNKILEDNKINVIKSYYSPLKFIPHPSSTIETEAPIFIIGMPRSGTTLIEQVLSGHSHIYGGGERIDITNIISDICSKTSSSYPECMTNINADSLDAYANTYLQEIQKETGGTKYFTDKMPNNYLYLGFIKQLFPKAKFIHCIRNPIDTCLSIYFKSFNDSHNYANDLNDLAHNYHCYSEVTKFWKSTFSSSILEVRYEYLIDNFEKEVNRIIGFCDLDVESDCVNFHNNTRKVHTASQDQVTQPLYNTSVNRWKNYMPDVQELINELEQYNSICISSDLI